MSEMIERVAQAIAGSRDCEIPCIDPLICSCRSDARAAIAAMREPTEAMKLAFNDHFPLEGGFRLREVAAITWPAMIDAAVSNS